MPEPVASVDSLFPPYPPTLPEVLARAVASFGDQELLVSGGRRLSFRQVDELSARLACGLLALGVGKGSRVGILMPNSPDWVLCFLAAARVGALAVPISTFYQAQELSWVLRHSDIHTLLTVDRYLDHDYLARLETVGALARQPTPALVVPELPYLRHVIVWGTGARSWIRRGPDDLVRLAASEPRLDRGFLASAESQVTPADDLLIIYTSGSTVEPKAVVHTHASVIRLSYALYSSGWGDVEAGDRVYSAVPFFWIGGLNSNLLPALFTGACMVMTATPDVDEVIDICQQEDVTSISAWSAQLRAVDERLAGRGVVLPHLRSRWTQYDDDGKVIPLELIPNILGMTETFGPHGLEPRGTRLPAAKARAFGRALPGIERKVLDPATGEECASGQPGELYVRGFSLMRGFYKRLPEDTFDRDGFYPTGDRCRVDDEGFLYFEGRLGEMIKTIGANVSPREVEASLEACVEVREAAVFGIPDAARGEAIVAVVVPAAGATIDAPGLLAVLRGSLSHYKVPRFVFAMDYDDIPRTATAKIRKQLLREIVVARWGPLTDVAGSRAAE